MTHDDALRALEILTALYPDAGPELDFSNPYETLVATILSAQCTDKQVNRVTPAVFRDFPDVESMAKATPEILYPYVKSCGFKSKAEKIVFSCRRIMEDFGGEIPRTMEELTSLPGVGRKTANVVMASAFGLPCIAVDTHVFRVSNRIGLVKADNVLDTEKQLTALIAPEKRVLSHHLLIFHGRRVCHAQKPACETCALRALCDKIKAEESHAGNASA